MHCLSYVPTKHINKQCIHLSHTHTHTVKGVHSTHTPTVKGAHKSVLWQVGSIIRIVFLHGVQFSRSKVFIKCGTNYRYCLQCEISV